MMRRTGNIKGEQPTKTPVKSGITQKLHSIHCVVCRACGLLGDLHYQVEHSLAKKTGLRIVYVCEPCSLDFIAESWGSLNTTGRIVPDSIYVFKKIAA
jgi:hypothetical protein